MVATDARSLQEISSLQVLGGVDAGLAAAAALTITNDFFDQENPCSVNRGSRTITSASSSNAAAKSESSLTEHSLHALPRNRAFNFLLGAKRSSLGAV